MNLNSLNRRTFLKGSVLAAAGVALSARSWGQVPGAATDLRVAVIGLNGRGKAHVGSLQKIPGVRIVALCDVDTAVLEKTRLSLGEAGASVKTYVDVRELLGSPDIDRSEER